MTSPQVLPLTLLRNGITITPLTAGSFAAARYHRQQVENINCVHFLITARAHCSQGLMRTSRTSLFSFVFKLWSEINSECLMSFQT